MSNVLVIAVYRPPSTSFAEFINDFSSVIEVLILSPGKLIILGDFNIHTDIVNDRFTQHFLETLDSFNLKQHVSEPTHSSGHILDLVITCCSDDLGDIYVDQPQLSDYNSVRLHLNLSKPPPQTKKLHYR